MPRRIFGGLNLFYGESSTLEKQSPARVERFRNQIEGAGCFGDWCESAGIAIDLAPAFDIAASRDCSIRIDIDKDVVMAAPIVIDHGFEAAG